MNYVIQLKSLIEPGALCKDCIDFYIAIIAVVISFMRRMRAGVGPGTV